MSHRTMFEADGPDEAILSSQAAKGSRTTQSLTFSLLPLHVDLIRATSVGDRVSQSQVVRAALDHYFAGRGEATAKRDGTMPEQAHGTTVPAMSQLVRELAAVRREITGIRQAIGQLGSTLSDDQPAVPISARLAQIDHVIDDVASRIERVAGDGLGPPGTPDAAP